MRIGLNGLFFIPDEIDGIGVYATNLIHSLAQVAPYHEYVLFVSRESRHFFKELPACMRVVVLPAPARIRPFRVIFEQCILPFYIWSAKVDILHSLAFTSPLLVTCPSIVHIHDVGFRYWAERFSRLAILAQEIVVPRVARKSSRVITISQYARSEIASALGIQTSKISVVYGAHNHDLFHRGQSALREPDEGLTSKYGISCPYILSVASLHPHKNLDGLIRAYALLVADQNIAHQLVLVGHKRTSLAQIVDLIDTLNLRSRVILAGFVPNQDIASVYSHADVFVFPSFYEGFGIPPLEAMACGTPVVCSNMTALPEVVGEAAILVNPYDIEAIAASILQVLQDADLRTELVHRGLERVSLFSWEKAARETITVYEQVWSAHVNKQNERQSR